MSFDIDGTLESGDPGGPIPLDAVRMASGFGWFVGSCSDRTLREQRDMWSAEGIVVDFVSAKHQLRNLRHAFPARRFIHIGDTSVDLDYADRAGFEYFDAGQLCGTDARESDLSWVLGLGIKEGEGPATGAMRR